MLNSQIKKSCTYKYIFLSIICNFNLTQFLCSLNFIRLLRVVITPSVLRGENVSKQSDEFQANFNVSIYLFHLFMYFNYFVDLFSSEIVAILRSTNSKLNKVFDWLIWLTDWLIVERGVGRKKRIFVSCYITMEYCVCLLFPLIISSSSQTKIWPAFFSRFRLFSMGFPLYVPQFFAVNFSSSSLRNDR